MLVTELGNPRYGVIGLLVMPYYVVFEGIGPLIELTGYLLTGLAVAITYCVRCMTFKMRCGKRRRH